MTNLIKLSLTTVALLVIAAPAHAQDTFTVKLKQTPGTSVEANYASMESQATRFCKREIRRDLVGQTIVPPRMTKVCVKELMDEAIAQIEDPILMALHTERSGKRTVVVSNESNDKKASAER